jgi:hypothetical protein
MRVREEQILRKAKQQRKVFMTSSIRKIKLKTSATCT